MISKSLINIALGLLVATFAAVPASFAGEAEQGPSLYERLGSWDGIGQIVNDTIALHLENPDIGHYFEGVDTDKLAAHVTAFFAAGTGGVYLVQQGASAAAVMAYGFGVVTLVMVIGGVSLVPRERADFVGRGGDNPFRALRDIASNRHARSVGRCKSWSNLPDRSNTHPLSTAEHHHPQK